MSKFSKLFALANKASGKTFSVTRKEAEGSVAMRFDGFPAEMSAAGVEALAADKGGRVTVTATVGAATGKAQGILGMAAAAEMVREITTEGDVPQDSGNGRGKSKGSAAA